MGLFSRSFDKPGKGVDPDEPQKRSFFRFFDIFFRKFWHFGRLNLLYAVFIIPTFILVFLLAGVVSNSILAMPNVEALMENLAQQMAQAVGDMGTLEQQRAQLIVTLDLFVRLTVTYLFTVLWGMGPATAGLTYVLRNFAREEHAWIWSDFKDAMKSNFKQAIAVFLIDAVVFLLFCFAYSFYAQMSGLLGAMRYVIAIIALIVTLMHFYLYPLMVTFQLSLKDLYRNSLLFALGKLPSNLFVLAILLVLHLGSAVAVITFGGSHAMMLLFLLLLLEVLILLSFSAFLVNFNAYPKMKRYMLLNNEEPVKGAPPPASEDTAAPEPVQPEMYETYTDYRAFAKPQEPEEGTENTGEKE